MRSQGETTTAEPGQLQHCANHLSPSESINLYTSKITERLRQFHAAMATLANVQCDVCLERFLSLNNSTCSSQVTHLKMAVLSANSQSLLVNILPLFLTVTFSVGPNLTIHRHILLFSNFLKLIQ